MPRMSEEEIKQKLQEAFEEVDADKDGYISHDDLKVACQKAGVEPSENDIQELIKACDEEGNGKISFEEFANAIVETYVKLRILMKLKNAFMLMDTDGSGFITKENLKELVAEHGEQLTDEDADKLISSVDKSGDGQVSFAEFVEAAAEFLEEKLKEQQ